MTTVKAQVSDDVLQALRTILVDLEHPKRVRVETADGLRLYAGDCVGVEPNFDGTGVWIIFRSRPAPRGSSEVDAAPYDPATDRLEVEPI